jgi:glycosyltransferase involved in cell wall biosynthesis
LRRKLGLTSEDRMVLYLGRLEASKGISFLLEAFSRLDSQNAVLIIAGDGSERTALEAAARQAGVDRRVRFAGYVPIESAPEYYSLAWVFVLPSITMRSGKEPWGLVVNEAFNQGVPVIVTDAVGAAAGGLVIDGLNGLIVAERDAGALANAMRRLLLEPGLRDRLGAHARRTISDWDYMGNTLGYDEAIRYVRWRRKTGAPRFLP